MGTAAAATTFDKKSAVAQAAEARGKGDRKKAIALYRDVLAHDPSDHEVHGRLAQLLAESGDLAQAAASFRLGADGYHKVGFTDRAIALLKQAVEHVPDDVDAWLSIASFNVERERKKEADKVLADARTRFVRKRDLAAASRLLDARLKLDGKNVAVAIDRARVAKRMGQRGFGVLLLEDVLSLVDQRERRRLRRALFSLQPTPASLWRFLVNRAP
jgi:tetratricopeptide (TPR) repeat protein